MTTIVCVSDLHEHLVDVPACDLLLIAGDVSFAFTGDLTAKRAFLAGSREEVRRDSIQCGDTATLRAETSTSAPPR